MPEHESVEVPDAPRATLVGDNVQVKPVEGDMPDARATVPVNP